MRVDLAFELLFFALLCYIGVVLVKAGMRGRRVGSTPRCPQCDYDLTGLPGARCPECGTDVLKKGPVFGERQRRWGSIGTGVISLAIAGLFLIPMYDLLRHAFRNEWYWFRPTSMVLNDLHDRRTADQAARELGRRLRQGSLSQRQKKAATSSLVSALVAQRAASRYTEEVVDLGADLLRAGLLTVREQEAFLRSIEAMDVCYDQNQMGRKRGYPQENCIRINNAWLMLPRQASLGWVPRRRVEIVAIDDRPLTQVIMDRPQVVDWSNFYCEPLPVPPQRSVLIRVTTSWYDFGPEYSRDKHANRFKLDENKTVMPNPPIAGVRPLYTYTDDLILSPKNGWRASLPLPRDPSRTPASAPSTSGPAGSPEGRR